MKVIGKVAPEARFELAPRRVGGGCSTAPIGVLPRAPTGRPCGPAGAIYSVFPR